MRNGLVFPARVPMAQIGVEPSAADLIRVRHPWAGNREAHASGMHVDSQFPVPPNGVKN